MKLYQEMIVQRKNGEVSDNDKTAKNDVTSDNSDIAASENNADPDNTNNAE